MKKQIYKDADEIAQVYDVHGKNYHESRAKSGRLANEFIDMPATQMMFPKSVKDLQILDAGCGSGIYSRLLASKGAIVTGVDISKEMLKIAKNESEGINNIKYVQANLYELPFKSNSFDLIICTYVLENIEKLEAVFSEFSRVLKNKSHLIFSISHPFRRQSNIITYENERVLLLRDYFKREKVEIDFGDGMIVPKFRRPFQEYTKALFQNKFVIVDFIEMQPVKEGKKFDTDGYEKAMRLPQLLTIKARKELTGRK